MSKWFFLVIGNISKLALEGEIFGFSRLRYLGVGFVFALGFLWRFVDALRGVVLGCDAFYCLAKAMKAHSSCVTIADAIGGGYDAPVDLVTYVSKWLED